MSNKWFALWIALAMGGSCHLVAPIPGRADEPAAVPDRAEAHCVVELCFSSAVEYSNPFLDVEVAALVTQPDGRQLRVPAFWAGAGQWRVRYASGIIGSHTYRTVCSDTANTGLHAVEGMIDVVPYRGDNPLLLHGPVQVAADRRHFAHADGTPFLWLGDTWWKGLCRRLTWEGFQELTADRQAKGFSVVQIVCGPYPDEGVFEARWENEGGKPYETRDFTVVNPTYFDYADRRIRHLVDAGIVPAIVGGWGRADCDAMQLAGVDGMKRHWRHLVARYGALPTVWIIGGESGGPQWTEVARYVQEIDPYQRLVTVHPFDSGRTSVTDETVVDFDMLQTGHGDWNAAQGAIPKFRTAYARTPVMPVMIGEYCYEGHMQTAFQDVQRYVFWSSMLSGSAGLTYGAAGVWHASVEGDPGLANVYDRTTWREGMQYPGSTQLGLGKRLLEQYPWWRFAPHPEWAEPDCFAAGVPGEVRFIYQPRRGVYNWQGTVVKGLEPGVPYRACYVDPVNGKRYEAGTFVSTGPPRPLFAGHAAPLLASDSFDQPAGQAWEDHGTPSQVEAGCLVGGKGLVTVLADIREADLMVSVDARSDAEAGIVLRFQDADQYVVALYSPLLKAIFLHDRQDGTWGEQLGHVDVPEIGPQIHLTAATCGSYAALVLTDGTRTYATPPVTLRNTARGQAGLWLYQIGDRQAFDNFQLSRTPFAPPRPASDDATQHPLLWCDEFRGPTLPSPQDWILILERIAP